MHLLEVITYITVNLSLVEHYQTHTLFLWNKANSDYKVCLVWNLHIHNLWIDQNKYGKPRQSTEQLLDHCPQALRLPPSLNGGCLTGACDPSFSMDDLLGANTPTRCLYRLSADSDHSSTVTDSTARDEVSHLADQDELTGSVQCAFLVRCCWWRWRLRKTGD